MPRSQKVTVAGKEITVTERKIKELEALAGELAGIADAMLKANTTDDVKNVLVGLLYDKIPVLFPPLTAEDVKEAYPSELGALMGAFVDLHFFPLKNLLGPVMTIVQAGLQGKF